MQYNSPEEDLEMKIIAEIGKVESDAMPNKHSSVLAPPLTNN